MNRLAYALSFDNAESNVLDRIKFGSFNWTFAIQRLSEAPGADRVLQALKGLGERVDELQRQTRGFADFEKRLTALEKRVDSIAKPKPARKRKTASAARPPKSDATPKQP